MNWADVAYLAITVLSGVFLKGGYDRIRRKRKVVKTYRKTRIY